MVVTLCTTGARPNSIRLIIPQATDDYLIVLPAGPCCNEQPCSALLVERTRRLASDDNLKCDVTNRHMRPMVETVRSIEISEASLGFLVSGREHIRNPLLDTMAVSRLNGLWMLVSIIFQKVWLGDESKEVVAVGLLSAHGRR